MTNTQPPSKRVDEATNAHLAQFSDSDMAYHEAGHAVIHHLGGGTIKRISIDRTDDRRGVRIDPKRAAGDNGPEAAETTTPEDPKTKLTHTISVLVAGDAAGTIHGTPEQIVTAGSRVDHDQALRTAAEAGLTPQDARAMIDDAWERAREQLRQPETWRLVDALAKELIQQRALEGDRIAAILKG